MIGQIAVFSLIITGIYTSFQEGNIFSFIRVFYANIFDKAFGRKASRYIQKPLWDCLPCMGSIWTILLSWIVTENVTWRIDVLLILAVCGLNLIIDRIIDRLEIPLTVKRE